MMKTILSTITEYAICRRIAITDASRHATPGEARRIVRAVIFLAVLPAVLYNFPAQAFDLQPGESVEYVTDAVLLGSDRLETTVYRPAIPGPWPLVVLNHGNAAVPDKHTQPRWRPDWVANFFTRQGYMVIVPMRRGYAGSSGTFAYNCNPLAFGDRAADDVEAAIRFYVRRDEVNPQQIMVIGQSQGGLVALAYASKYHDARGVVSTDGGIAAPDPRCSVGWEGRLIAAGRVLGASAKVPSLWMYAHDDPIFPPAVFTPFFNAYRGAGAHAQLVTVAHGGHAFMWQPLPDKAQWRTAVERFMAELGLPTRQGGTH